MTKLAVAQRVPQQYNPATIAEIVRQIEQQVNQLAEGAIVARHGAMASVPAAGSFARGDIVWDSAPALTNGSLRLGWVCITSGSPGTFQEIRLFGVSGTEVASTSGTAIDFTGIPSWAKKIIILFSGVSTNGTSDLIVQLGDSGGVENTGYLSGASVLAASVSSSNHTAGFGVATGIGAGAVMHGAITLTLENSANFTWVSQGLLGQSNAGQTHVSGGSKALSAALDRVRITTAGGTDAFDAGAMNIIYK